MNQEEIKKILDDLYSIDKSFKAYERQLIALVNELIMAKPSARIDENFKNELKTKLIIRAEELMKQKPMLNLKKVYYLTGALAVIILIVAPALYLLNRSQSITRQPGLQIVQVADNAFGSLKNTTAATANFESSADSASAMQRSSNGGGGLAVGSVSLPSPSIYPEMTNYRFVYKGEALSLPAESMEVLKRIKGLDSGSGLNQLLSGLNFAALDLNKFSDAKLQNLTLVQDKDYGLTLYIDFGEGNISIGQNYLKWPNPYLDCRDENCYQAHNLKMEDLPSDETLIQVSRDFLNQLNIDLKAYGEPLVNKQWLENYQGGPDGVALYVPEQINVIYPLLINGQYVYDGSGNKQGLNVDINIREMKVIGLYNLTAHNYQSSSYQTAGAEEIIKLAETGGYNFGYYYSDALNMVDLELGTPSLAWLTLWHNVDDSMQADELIVPAYVFPITNAATANYWQKSIVVPLIKDLLQENYNGPRPLPLEMPATTAEPSITEPGADSNPVEQPIQEGPGPVELKIRTVE